MSVWQNTTTSLGLIHRCSLECFTGVVAPWKPTAREASSISNSFHLRISWSRQCELALSSWTRLPGQTASFCYNKKGTRYSLWRLTGWVYANNKQNLLYIYIKTTQELNVLVDRNLQWKRTVNCTEVRHNNTRLFLSVHCRPGWFTAALLIGWRHTEFIVGTCYWSRIHDTSM